MSNFNKLMLRKQMLGSLKMEIMKLSLRLNQSSSWTRKLMMNQNVLIDSTIEKALILNDLKN